MRRHGFRWLALLALVGASCQRTRNSEAGAQASAQPVLDRRVGGARIEKDAWRYCDQTDQACEARCASGDLMACTSLAASRVEGTRKTPSIRQTEADLIQACNAEVSKGCAWLAHLYRTGAEGVRVNGPEAVRLYEKACSREQASSCSNAALAYGKGDLGVKKQPKKALSLAERGCSYEDGDSCSTLGIFHEKGIGVEADIHRAMALYEKACNLTAAIGCFNLAEVLDSGRKGVEIDHARAASLYEKACEGEYWAACNNLGHLLVRSATLPLDPKRAFELFTKSCKNGLPEGCGSMGEAYEGGLGVPRNEKKAARWYSKSCEMGHASGCDWILRRDRREASSNSDE